MAEIGKNLVDAVKKLAFKTSVDQLKQKGVKQVNVVGLDRLAALIQEAVKKSLQHRLAGLDRDAIADQTKEEFLRLLRRNETLEKEKDEIAKLRERAQQELESLRGEIDAGRRALEQHMRSAAASEAERYAGENAAIQKQIEALFASFVQSGAKDLGGLRDAIFTSTVALVDKERKESLVAREAARDREVELLERRVEKLKVALTENEKLMAHAATLLPGDPGIASIYKSVQGLSVNDSSFARKKDMMSGIFQANLALQKKVDNQKPPAPDAGA